MPQFFKRKIFWIPAAIIVVLIGLHFIVKGKGKTNYTTAGTVSQQDVRQSVLATGTVTSQSDLNLSFKNAGTVTQVNASVGDKVHKGQVLAALDERDASAAINQASASLLAAKANYQKLVDGASDPEIQVDQAAVDSAQVALTNAQNSLTDITSQQATLVNNAFTAMLNAGLAAIPASTNTSTGTVTVSGTYNGKDQGQINLSLFTSSNGTSYSATGLEQATGTAGRGGPIALGTHGLFITFSPTGSFSSGDTWTIPIPNTQAPTYLSASNAYQASLQTQTQTVTAATGAVATAQASLQQAQANLDLQKAAPRTEDLSASQAQVQNAQAALEVAQNQYANNEIVAPIDGTMTAINVKLGETASPQTTAITMLDQADLHVESDISESSISQVQVGQSVDMTLDALGPDTHLTGEVISIDPASTVISGVIDYRVISSLPVGQDGIKPGMTVNLVIVSAEKQNVLAVPNRLIATDAQGNETVKILKNGQPTDVPIKTGLAGDQFTEVTSGLSGGETLVSTDTGTASN